MMERGIKVVFSEHERLDKILSRVADQGRASDADVRELIRALGATQPRPSKRVLGEVILNGNGGERRAAGRIAAHVVGSLLTHLVDDCRENIEVWHSEMMKWEKEYLSDDD